MENCKNDNDVIISGIKCDNPECGFKDMTIKFEDYPEWVNKSCPWCGENLLTKRCYKKIKKMKRKVERWNAIVAFINNTFLHKEIATQEVYANCDKNGRIKDIKLR